MFGRLEIRCRYPDVEGRFREWEIERQSLVFVQALEAFIPFWKKAISVCAEATQTPEEKQEKLQGFVDRAPSLLRAWSVGDLRLVRARQKEVWSATSFVRNAALKEEVRCFKLAPVFRNLHSVLASAIKVSAGEHSAEELPELLFSLCYDIAFVETLFEYDNSDLMHFSHELKQGTLAHQDYVIEVYKAASIQMKKRRSMQRVFDRAAVVVDDLGSLDEFRVDEKLWRQRNNSNWYNLRQAGFAAFHRKPI